MTPPTLRQGGRGGKRRSLARGVRASHWRRPPPPPQGCKPLIDLPLVSTLGRATILMLDRGGCYFLEKAMNAQLAGADAVLLAPRPPP